MFICMNWNTSDWTGKTLSMAMFKQTSSQNISCSHWDIIIRNVLPIIITRCTAKTSCVYSAAEIYSSLVKIWTIKDTTSICLQFNRDNFYSTKIYHVFFLYLIPHCVGIVYGGGNLFVTTFTTLSDGTVGEKCNQRGMMRSPVRVKQQEIICI